MNFKTMQEAYDNRHPEDDSEFYSYEEAVEAVTDKFLQTPEIWVEFLANNCSEPVGNVLIDEVTMESTSSHLMAVILNGFDSSAQEARYILRHRIVDAYLDEIKQEALWLVGNKKD